MTSFLKKHITALSICFLSFCVLCILSYLNEFSEGGADNYWHYYFSKYAFEYPQFFLHHWGKPLFILLSAPFSQFGFYGLKLFNVLCGIASAWVCYQFAIELKFKYSWLVIIILLFSPLYFFVLQSALTEPLMSLLLISVCYLLYIEKFLFAALLMSFSLYARSEGLFLTIYVLMYLSLIKQWKYIPFLFTGFFIYSTIGWLTGRDFLWYFTENPYNIISPYGHGDWGDFFDKYSIIWGLLGSIMLVFGLLLILFFVLKNIKSIKLTNLAIEHKLLLLIVMPAFIFFMFHVVVWKYGMCGSCGLERVLACVFPMFALIIAYAIQHLTKQKIVLKIQIPIIILFVFFMVSSGVKRIHYPLKASGDEKVESITGKWFKETINQNCIVYYAHPAIIFYTNRNPFDKQLNIEQFGFNPDILPQKMMPTYVFWDSQFSDFSCGVKLQTLLHSNKLKLIKHEDDCSFHLYVFEVI